MRATLDRAIKCLREAFRKNDLTVFLGAGVSAASGVPTWHRLVLTIFLNSLRTPQQFDPASHALIQATAELWFARNSVPLEVAARELRSSFRDPDEFLRWVRFALYGSFEFDSHGYPTPNVHSRLKGNATLQAMVALCHATKPSETGLRAIVTYNLDGLLELSLGSYPFQSLWKQARVRHGVLPIYHVHGFIPVRESLVPLSQRTASSPDEIVLTEDQYHRQAADPYSWANIVQLHALTNSTGLTVGLSLSDRNMRRLLDVTKGTPIRQRIYALLQRPDVRELTDRDLTEIGDRERPIAEFYQGFFREPLPRPDILDPKVRHRVARIWSSLYRQGVQRQTSVLRDLGVEPIWCAHSEIPGLVDAILGRG